MKVCAWILVGQNFLGEFCCVDLEVLNLKGYWLKTPEEVKKSLEKDCTTPTCQQQNTSEQWLSTVQQCKTLVG